MSNELRLDYKIALIGVRLDKTKMVFPQMVLENSGFWGCDVLRPDFGVA